MILISAIRLMSEESKGNRETPHLLKTYEINTSILSTAQDVRNKERDFPGGTMVKNPPANAGDTGSSPGLERSHMPRSN